MKTASATFAKGAQSCTTVSGFKADADELAVSADSG
jgi:hypothetical protein